MLKIPGQDILLLTRKSISCFIFLSHQYHPRSKLYIKTEHAWYILYVPSPNYYNFFAPFWIKARLFHQVISSLHEDRRMSYEDFLDALPDSDASEAAEDVLGCRLTQADLQSDDTVSISIRLRYCVDYCDVLGCIHHCKLR